MAVGYASNGDPVIEQRYPGRLVLLDQRGREVWSKSLDLATFEGSAGPRGRITMTGFLGHVHGAYNLDTRFPGQGLVLYGAGGERLWKKEDRLYKPLGLTADGQTAVAWQPTTLFLERLGPGDSAGRVLWLDGAGRRRC